MYQFIIRYQLNSTDVKRLVLVKAQTLDQATDKAFAWIDSFHGLKTEEEREEVVIDNSNPFNL
jgi:hypothetical protein